MKRLDFGRGDVFLLEGNVVLVEPDSGMVIDRPYAMEFYRRLDELLNEDYRLVIHRKHRYQLLRVEVFNVINRQDRLRGMAIVVDSDAAGKMAELEAPLSNKPFATFTSLDEALAWLATV